VLDSFNLVKGTLPGGNDRFVGMILCALVGVTLYALAAFVLWSLASQRFRVLSGRIDRLPPRRPPDVAVPVREAPPPSE
jgi:hypothetical protein